MPFQKITLRPGINTQATTLLNEGGWSDCNLIRFKEGMAETYGGWTIFSPQTIQGVARGSHAWQTLGGVPTLGAGTDLRLYVFQGGSPYDVTPIVQTTTPTSPFTTIMSSTQVTVSDSSLTFSPPAVGSFIEVSGGTAVGGITLSGEYQITSTLSTTSYTIDAGTAATSGATGGGTPTIEYLLPAGFQDAATTAGYGSGPYGDSTYGTPRAGGGIGFARTWAIDNFGEVMVANPRGGGIYVWLPSTGLGVRAAAMTNAPAQCNYAFVSSLAQQVIALGCSDAATSVFNPMIVRWSTEGDYTVWVGNSGNSAGEFPLTDGTQLMWGGHFGQQILIWSDTSLYGMQFIGGQDVYGFTSLGTACGLIAPNAACIVNSAAYWMSGENFMSYNGYIIPLECSVRDKVYGNINLTQVSKINCSLNTQFNEARWDYPSLHSLENDSYVIYNYMSRTWVYGNNDPTSPASIARTTWIDANVFGNPIAFDAQGQSWTQESGYNAGGFAMPWFIETGEFDLSPGEEIMFADQMWPDQRLRGPGPVAIYIYSRMSSGDTFETDATVPFQITGTTKFVPFALRGRQMKLRFDNSFGAINTLWRHGALRVRVAPDGRG